MSLDERNGIMETLKIMSNKIPLAALYAFAHPQY
jgi:hypothetical protein